MSPLGHPATRFIGRSGDLDRLALAFDGGARLVTISGPAGMGKTRLARQYAERARHRGTPVWFCELDTAAGLGELVAEIARAVDAPVAVGAGDEDAAAQLGRALMGRGHALFVLDNVDHIAAECVGMVEGWLALSGPARFLITSREPLEIPLEVVRELLPLSMPASTRDVARAEAVELMVDRARTVGRTIAVSNDTGESIAALVRRLNGIPLAIELVAARLDSFGASDVLDRLPRYAQSRASDEPGRPAALRAALTWSWESLSDDERAALAQSSVFRGGFTLEAAEQVIEVDADVASVLRSLVRKSLLVARHDYERPRFGHHDSILAFAGDRLGDAAEATQRRHRDHYLGRAAPWCAAIERNGSPQAQRSLADELANLVAIHERAATGGDCAASLAAALALDPVYAWRGPVDSHLRVMTRSLSVCSAARDSAVNRVFRARGNASRSRGRLDDAVVDLERALEGAEPALQAAVLADLGVLHHQRGHVALAAEAYDRALTGARGCGERRIEARALSSLAALAHDEGRLADAEIDYRRALELLRGIGELRSQALCLGRLGAVVAALDDVDTALAHIDAGERLLERVGDDVALAAVRLARCFIDLANAARARRGESPGRADELLASVRARIAEARIGDPALVQRSDDARWLVRTIEAAVAGLDPSAAAQPSPALEVGPEARWFRPPNGEPQDLNRRKALRLILLHLTEERRKSPGQGVSVGVLQQAGWPGEKIRADAGANRVYVSLNKLRNMGLEGILVRSEHGYLLDPSVKLERVAKDWRAIAQ